MNIQSTGPLDGETADTLLAQLKADPQLPVPNPTSSLWQEQLHPLSSTQSSPFPNQTEYAIIGSGVTATSVAKTLLEDSRSKSDRITILEARTLCSGATGRNGGHLVSPVPGEFSKLVSTWGLDMAVKIARFNDSTLEKMHKLAAEADDATKQAAELRRTRSLVAFREQHAFDECKESVEMYEKYVPEARGSHRFVDAHETKEVYGFKDCVGALEEPSGAFWPYRLVTGTLGKLVSVHSNRFAIETHTPVYSISSIDNSEYPCTLHTSRGSITAKHVIHCTNGHTSHLLPALRGLIYPLRGTMSVQTPDAEFPRLGHRLSWALQKDSSYQPATGTIESGLYYATQNANTGDIFIGGEKSNIREILSSDDGNICNAAKENIEAVLPKIFERYQGGTIKSVWSGILAFTADFLPLVGQLPKFVVDPGSQDEMESGQWIAAGFNGYGMPQCWSAGEAVAKLILGGEKGRKEVLEWLPERFEVTKQRFDFQNGPQSSLNSFMELMNLSPPTPPKI